MAVIDVHLFGFTYPGAQRPAIRGVSFAVEPREIFGSSAQAAPEQGTTQNVLIRLLDGYAGEYPGILGKDLRAWDQELLPSDWCRHSRRPIITVRLSARGEPAPLRRIAWRQEESTLMAYHTPLTNQSNAPGIQ